METGPSSLPPGPGRSRFADAPSIYLALVLFGLTVGIVYLLARLQLLLIILFLSLLLASGIMSPVRRLERHRLPRPAAILVVYLVIFGLLAAATWYILPPVVGQAGGFAEDMPRRLQELQQVRQRVAELSGEYPILQDLEERLVGLAGRAGDRATGLLLGLPEAIATTLFALVSVFTIAFLLLMTEDRLINLLLSLVHPRHRATTERVLAEMGNRLGAYLRAKLIVIAIVGTLVWVTLALLGSPYAVLVAIFAGLTEIVPRIGPWIGRAAILLAVAPLGWRAVGIALIAHVVIENLKGQLISPLIESDQVDIHPLTAFIAIISGGILLGWAGALIAVPLAAVIQVLVEQVLIPWRRAQLAAAEAQLPPDPAATAHLLGSGTAPGVAPAQPEPIPKDGVAVPARGRSGASSDRGSRT